MRYPVFLVWNALGGITWGITFCLVGYFAGASYEKVATTIGKGTAVVVTTVIAATVAWGVRRKRREREQQQRDDTSTSDAPSDS